MQLLIAGTDPFFSFNSGLYYYGFRFYDPNLQQWLNRDSLGESGGINLYGFVGNSPINSIDAYGLAIAISDLWNGDAWHQLSEDTGVSHAVRCVRNTVHHIFIGNPKANADIMRYSNLALRVQEGITISPGGEAMYELGTGMMMAGVEIAVSTPMFIEEGVFRVGGGFATGQKVTAVKTGTQLEFQFAKEVSNSVKGSNHNIIILTRNRNFGNLSSMPRQLRVEYPGAIYHSMSRGERLQMGSWKSVNNQLYLAGKAKGEKAKK